MISREEAIAAAGRAHAAAIERLDSRDPHEAAAAAWVPGGLSVQELEERIRAWQQERRQAPTDASPPTG